VTVIDFTVLKPTYGKSLGDSGYDSRADFSGDNLVNISDFTLLKGNSGQCGSPALIDTATATPTFTSVPTVTDTPTETATQQPTATPPSDATLVGHITVQGRSPQPSQRQSVPLNVTLKLNGGSADQYSVTSDPSGYFTITNALAPGNYSWRVKNPQTLANAGSATLVSGMNNVEMGQLVEGDATNDNCVSAPDFTVVKVTYGKSLGDPNYDARADFNGDNAVTLVDFNTLKVNFGQCGAPVITSP
jgi:hypothetical protein